MSFQDVSPYFHIWSCQTAPDFDTVRLPYFDWCTHAWIQHWPREGEESSETHAIWDYAVAHYEEAIHHSDDFLFRGSDFGGAFSTILRKQRLIYRALNTHCGKYTSATSTMCYHELQPWDPRHVLEAHDVPFVDGTSEHLMNNYRALIRSGILCNLRWGMSSDQDNHTVVLTACLDI